MLRNATLDDADTLAAIHIEGWQAAYGGMVDQAYLDSLSVESRASDWRGWLASGESETLVHALDDGTLTGFITLGRTKTPPPGSSPIRPSYIGEVYALYLLPDFWRQGIGTTLFQSAVSRAQARKWPSLCLWVLERNARAKDFYDALGGQRLGKKMVEIGPSSVREICYGWKNLSQMMQSGK